MEGEVPVPAKERFSALDMLALVRELRSIVGGRVDKAFTALPAGVTLVFRVPGAKRRELVILSGRYAALRDAPGRHAEELSPVARELRRLLTGAQLSEVPDPAGERYLELVFRRADVGGSLLLGVELFGSGNLVVARDGVLAAVEHSRRWAHRAIRVGAEYQRPPTRGNPFEASASTLAATLRGSRTDRASTLAARLGLGGPVAEELLARAGVPGTVAAPTDCEAVAERLARALQELLTEVGDSPRGYLYSRGEVLVDVSPVAQTRWKGVGAVVESERPTFSEAADAYFTSLPAGPETAPSPEDAARAELERLRERQLAAVEGLREAIHGLQAQAEAILHHFPEAERALEGPAPEHSDGRVEVELGGLAVTLLHGRPVRDSATALFEEAKRLKGKLAGAEAALSETIGKIELLRTSRPTAPAPGDGGRRGTGPARRSHWFERYRWFLSSEGILVIGGRDAQSNDLLVRRYLHEGDIYLHADVHGAPSVIVKHPPPGSPGPGEATLREAGQWGFCFSKAWRAGLASGQAFWVTPDQVSKAGASGEFVPRGAWVIHGTKNYLKDLPAELALGTVELEGESRWVVAPPDALRARGAVRVILAPGEERERARTEVELARELGVPRERLQALLPAGGISIRRV